MDEAFRADLREVFGAHVDLGRAADWLGKGYDPGMIREVVRELAAPESRTLRLWHISTPRHAKRPETPAEPAKAAAAVDWDQTTAMYARGDYWSR